MTENDMREKIEAVVAAAESQIDASVARERRVRLALRRFRERVRLLERSLERDLPQYHRERVLIRLEVWRLAERLLEKACE